MSNTTINNTKLGIFVLSGLFFLVMALFLIGKNRSFFGSYYTLRAHFNNVYGLTKGNNVRYSGIQVGTVQDIKLLSDTIIEITFTVKKDLAKFIHKEDIVSIGGEGLMGNKVININPSSGDSPLVKDGDLLKSKLTANLDKMIEVLGETTDDIKRIAVGLQKTVDNINNSTALWDLLKDESLPAGIRNSVQHILATTQSIQKSAADLNSMMADIHRGKGNLGMMLRDSSLAIGLNNTVEQANETVKNTHKVTEDLRKLIAEIDDNVRNGKGIVNGILKDESMKQHLAASLRNIEDASAALNENMEALKRNIFFRGYFKKKEKARLKAEKDASSGN